MGIDGDVWLVAGQWDSMEEYMCYIPRTTYEGTFYRAVFALHMENYQQAQQVSLIPPLPPCFVFLSFFPCFFSYLTLFVSSLLLFAVFICFYLGTFSWLSHVKNGGCFLCRKPPATVQCYPFMTMQYFDSQCDHFS